MALFDSTGHDNFVFHQSNFHRIDQNICHDITEILLKVALNTINLTHHQTLNVAINLHYKLVC
jgi:hypothetical protein